MVHRVLVAVDGTAASNTALEIACALADNYDAALGLLTVLKPKEINDELLDAAQTEGIIAPDSSFSAVYEAGYNTFSSRQSFRDLERAEKASRLAMMMAESVVEKARAFSGDKPFKAIKTFISSGEPAKAILDCAEDNAADIIIMGHDQQGRIESLFKSSVAYDVQRDAKCPVLIYCQPK